MKQGKAVVFVAAVFFCAEEGAAQGRGLSGERSMIDGAKETYPIVLDDGGGEVCSGMYRWDEGLRGTNDSEGKIPRQARNDRGCGSE